MRLSQLEPALILIADGNTLAHIGFDQRPDGISFLCPQCFKDNGGSVGTHSILCWQPHVSQDVLPAPGRWAIDGDSFENLSLIAGSSSILLNESKCHAHFYVTNGDVVFCGDSGH